MSGKRPLLELPSGQLNPAHTKFFGSIQSSQKVRQSPKFHKKDLLPKSLQLKCFVTQVVFLFISFLTKLSILQSLSLGVCVRVLMRSYVTENRIWVADIHASLNGDLVPTERLPGEKMQVWLRGETVSTGRVLHRQTDRTAAPSLLSGCEDICITSQNPHVFICAFFS